MTPAAASISTARPMASAEPEMAVCFGAFRLAIQTVAPGPDAPLYADYYPLYRALYPALTPLFQAVSAVTARHLAQ